MKGLMLAVGEQRLVFGWNHEGKGKAKLLTNRLAPKESRMQSNVDIFRRKGQWKILGQALYFSLG